MTDIYVRTRKLTLRQVEEVGSWLDVHPTGPCGIRGISHKKFIQQYLAEHEGNKKIHILKVSFFNETDARHFMMEWS